MAKYTVTIEARAGWRNWFPVSPGAGFKPGPTVTALESRDEHIDLFCTDQDGSGVGHMVGASEGLATMGCDFPWSLVPARRAHLCAGAAG